MKVFPREDIDGSYSCFSDKYLSIFMKQDATFSLGDVNTQPAVPNLQRQHGSSGFSV